MVAFSVGVLVGAVVALVGVVAWAAWSVSSEFERAIFGPEDRAR